MSGEVAIALDARAPSKPDRGAPCNGCGLCCAVETCPLGMIRFLRRKGPCPALAWDEAGRRYACGLLLGAEGASCWLVARWIAAGRGCDCAHQGVTS